MEKGMKESSFPLVKSVPSFLKQPYGLDALLAGSLVRDRSLFMPRVGAEEK